MASYKRMDDSKIPSYTYIRKLCKLIASLVEEKSWIRRNRACVICFWTGLGVILHTHILFTSELALKPIMELMTTYIPTFSFTACYYNMLYNMDTVIRIIEHVTNSIENVEDEEEVNALNKYGEQTKFVSLFLACVIYSYMGLLFFPSFYSLHLFIFGTHNDSVLVLPVRMDYCLKTRFRFFFTLSIQYAIIISIGSVGVVYYSMTITSLQHACALFTIASIKIDRFLKDNVKGIHFTSSVSKSSKQSEWIIPVIESYNDAVDFVNLLLMVCKKSYCVEIVMIFLFLIMDFLHIFRLLEMDVKRDEVIRNSTYVIGSITIIYLAFYMGQRLIDHSANVYIKCCQVPFYALSNKDQKLLIMLMMRSSKPCSININGMMVTSHEVFAKVANTSYSLAIVCYRLR